jgi:DNA modification methylase
MIDIERVNLRKGRIPRDYVGGKRYEKKFLGELIRKDGSHYSRLERRSYYSRLEKKHPAKTPLHIARWAIQEYTRPDGWVLDPTIGVGTTAVEALWLGRNVAGMEIEFFDIIEANVKANNPLGKKFRLIHGDARDIGEHMRDLQFDLVINNPPYSGDVRQVGFDKKGEDGRWLKHMVKYDDRLPNLALLGENEEYWSTMSSIYGQCIDRLRKGGRFVIGIKDMMRNRKPFLLPEKFGDILTSLGMRYEGMAVLKHHPTTLNLNTYEKKFGVRPPLYQAILVFKK